MKVIGWRSPVGMLAIMTLLSLFMYKFPHKELVGGKEHYIFYIIGTFYILFLLFTGKIFVLTDKMIRVYSALTVFWGGNKHFLKGVEKIQIRGQKFTEIEIQTHTHTDKEEYTTTLSKKEVDQFKDYLRSVDIPYDQFRTM